MKRESGKLEHCLKKKKKKRSLKEASQDRSSNRCV